MNGILWSIARLRTPRWMKSGALVCIVLFGLMGLGNTSAAAEAPRPMLDGARLICGDEPPPVPSAGRRLPTELFQALEGDGWCRIAKRTRGQGFVGPGDMPVTGEYLRQINENLVPGVLGFGQDYRLSTEPPPPSAAEVKAMEVRVAAAENRARIAEAERDAAAKQAPSREDPEARRVANEALAAAEAASLRSWIALGLSASMLLFGLVAWVRRRLATVSPESTAGFLGPTAGVTIGLLFLPTYSAAVMVAAYAHRLGVDGKAVADLPSFSIGGFVTGLVFLIVFRRRITPRRLMFGLMVLAILAWLGMAMAPSETTLDVAVFAAGFSAVAGQILLPTAVAALQADSRSGLALTGRLFRALLLTLVGAYFLTSIAARRGLLTPMLLLMAGAVLLALTMLQRLLPRDGTKTASVTLPPLKELLKDRVLMVAVLAAAGSVGALGPMDTQIEWILTQQHYDVALAGAAFLVVLIGGFTATWWARQASPERWGLRRAQQIAASTLLAGLLLWGLGIYLGGLWWIVLFVLGFALVETGDTYLWQCAQYAAIKDPTDIGRSVMVLLPRYVIRTIMAICSAWVASLSGTREYHMWLVGIPLAVIVLALTIVQRKGNATSRGQVEVQRA